MKKEKSVPMKKKVSIENLKLIAVLEKEGIPTVANLLNIPASRIYNWKYGSSPTLDNLVELAKIVPNIDWNNIINGKSTDGELITANVQTDSEKELQELKRQMEDLKKRNQELENDKDTLGRVVKMYSELPSFPMPSEEAPVFDTIIVPMPIPYTKVGFRTSWMNDSDDAA